MSDLERVRAKILQRQLASKQVQPTDPALAAEALPPLKFAKEARYDCGQCRDSGFVTILHPAMVKELVRDPETKFERFCVVICVDCEANKGHGGEWTTGKRKGKQIPAFGDQPWHFARDNPRAILDAAAYEHRPDNYNSEFSQYGQFQ